MPSRLPWNSRPHAARGPLRSRAPRSLRGARDEHAPPPSPRATPAVLRFTRYGLPALAVLAGAISMAFGTSVSLAGGAGLVGAGLAIWLFSWLFRVGADGDRERAQE